MFLVQISSRDTYGRYRGVGSTVERATADLYHHFQPFPDSITVTRSSTSVFRRCEETSKFELLPKHEMDLAIRLISDTFERLRSSQT